jgi:hypothetical protein
MIIPDYSPLLIRVSAPQIIGFKNIRVMDFNASSLAMTFATGEYFLKG